MGSSNRNLNKYIKSKNLELKSSSYTFEDLFNIIHNQDDKVFAEYLFNYKILKISYKSFKSYCFKFATYLNNIKDPKSSYVGLYMENSINFIAVFWALLMLGYKPLLLNCKLPSEMNAQIIHTLNVKTIVSITALNLVDNEIIIEDTKGFISEVNNLEEYKPTSWEDELALSSTSTSLKYKICCYTGKDFTYQVLNAKGILSKNKMIKAHYQGELKLLAFLPFYHIFGLVALYFWFSVFGRTFVFLNDYSGDTILKTIRKHKVTHVFAVPLLWNTISKEIKSKISSFSESKQRKIKKTSKFCLFIQSIFPKLGMKLSRSIFKDITEQTLGDSIKFLITGGGYISNESLVMFNSIGYPLFNGYGSTEIGITSVELRKNPKKRIKGSVGKPFDSVEYKVINNVLQVKGKSLCSKIYFQNNKVEIVDKNSYFNTKDIVSIDKSNNYYINGREDDVIINRNGEKYNPDILEKNILLTTVNNYCIFDIDGNTIFLFEVNKNTNLFKKKLISDEINSCIEIMRKNKYPIDKIFYTEDSIVNKNAIKVSRAYVKKLIKENKIILRPYSSFLNEEEVKQESIKNETENIVASIFADVLKKEVESINVNDHFIFDLGGTSLDYCSLLVRLQQEFSLNFDFKEHSFSTVKEFSNYIIEKKGIK